jgi:ABC-type transporter Mla maintaining outer membrane lipid asymmetry ATPase subunit MlaF
MGLLDIEGLTHSFGENLLYKNVDFSLNKGGILELWDKMELEKVH